MSIAEIRDLSDERLTGDALILMYNVVIHGMRVPEDDEEFCESRLFLEPSANTRVNFERVQPNELSKFIKFLGEDGMKHEVNAKNATSMLISIGMPNAYSELLRLISSPDWKIAHAALKAVLDSHLSVLPEEKNPVLKLGIIAFARKAELEDAGIGIGKQLNPARNIPPEKLRDLRDSELTGEALAQMYLIGTHRTRISDCTITNFYELRFFSPYGGKTKFNFDRVPSDELNKFVKFLGKVGLTNEIRSKDAANVLIGIGTPEAYSEISRLLASPDEAVSRSALETLLKSTKSSSLDKSNPVLKLGLLAEDLKSQLEKAGLRSHKDIKPPEEKEKSRLR